MALLSGFIELYNLNTISIILFYLSYWGPNLLFFQKVNISVQDNFFLH